MLQKKDPLDKLFAIRLTTPQHARATALADALGAGISTLARDALIESIEQMAPAQVAEYIESGTLSLDPRTGGDLFLSAGDTMLCHIGGYTATSRWIDWNYGDVVDVMRDEMERQVIAEDKGWRWGQYPAGCLRFGFRDRGKDFVSALLEAHLSHRNGGLITIEEAVAYADTIQQMEEGQDPFSGVEEMYEQWQADCEDKGLEGWPAE